MARVGVTPSGAIGVDELQSIAMGAAVYGCGGGGSLAAGAPLVDELAAAISGRPVGLASLDELPDEARVAVPTPFPRPAATPSIAAAVAAFEALGARVGAPFDAVVAPDVSVFGALIALGVAVALDIPVVDASGSVRAAAQLDMTTWAAADISPGVVAIADTNDVVVIETDSIAGADSAVRAVVESGTFHGPIGAAGWAMAVDGLRRASIPAALSSACAVGAAIRGAADEATDPVGALVESIDRAVLVGRGRIARVTVALGERDEHVEIRVDTDRGPFEVVSLGSHVQLRSPQGLLVGAPDLIVLVGADGRAFTVRELTAPGRIGTEMSVVAAPVPDISPARVPAEAYGPIHRRFGTDAPVPFGIHQLDP